MSSSPLNAKTIKRKKKAVYFFLFFFVMNIFSLNKVWTFPEISAGIGFGTRFCKV